MEEEPKPNFWEIACKQIAGFYKRWEENARLNSLRTQPAVTSKQSDLTPDEKAFFNYADEKIREFYRRWEENNRFVER